MAKLPFLKFFPADYLQDTQVLSLDAQGAWMRLLCAMWVSPERGVLNWTLDQFNNYLGLTADRDYSAQIWNELQDSGIGEFYMSGNAVTDVLPTVTIKSRRMVREEHQRNRNATKQRAYRDRKVTGDILYSKTSYSRDIDTSKKKYLVDGPINGPDRESLKTEEKDPESLTVKDLVDSWNGVFAGRLSKVEWPLSPSRLKKAQARLREHRSLEFWQKVFDEIGQSRFLLGTGNGAWRCTLDFVVANDSNCIKIWEGQYHG